MGFALRKPVAVPSPLPDFDIAYQPVFDMGTGQVFAYEALVRGTNGEGADAILPRVEEERMTFFEEQICAMAIGKAAAMNISEIGANLLINVAPTTALNAIRSIGTAMELAAHAGLPRHRVAFELTERVRTDTRQAQAVVLAYRAHGFRTALDDFGAGYAGLVALADLPTDFVKLDMGLIRDIDSSQERRTIVGGVVRVLHDLGRIVIAEGVETAAELAAIRALGVTLVQGFYLGRPSVGRLQQRAYAR